MVHGTQAPATALLEVNKESTMSNDGKSYGIVVKNCKNGKVSNNTVSGADVGYLSENNEDVDFTENKYFAPIRVKPLVAAIKKPSANDNKGWKIMIVGALLAFLLAIAGRAAYDFYVEPSLSKMLAQPLQTEAVKESK